MPAKSSYIEGKLHIDPVSVIFGHFRQKENFKFSGKNAETHISENKTQVGH